MTENKIITVVLVNNKFIHKTFYFPENGYLSLRYENIVKIIQINNPYKIKTLDLTGNFIKNKTEFELCCQNLKNLIFLNLDQNLLSEVPDLRPCGSLLILILTNNKIENKQSPFPKQIIYVDI
jgi:Leucine-rich repeat (LRR) protein